MNYFSALYNTFFWSMIISSVAFKNVWLEMRINIGILFFILWIFLSVVFYFFKKQKSFIKNIFIFSFINLIVSIVIDFFILFPSNIFNVPASIIREGLYVTRIIKLSTINIIILIFIISGIFYILFFRLYELTKIKRN